MSLTSKLDQDYIAAYKAKDSLKVAVLRLLKTAMKNLLVERKGEELSDDDVLSLITKQVKQRKDSIDQYTKAGRPELAEAEAEELAVLETYLPPALSDAEVEGMVDEAIAQCGAESMKDMGKVMKAVMAVSKGRIDGKVASELVKKKLAS